MISACGDALSPQKIRTQLCGGAPDINMEELIDQVSSGRYRGIQEGRNFVLLSLAEAETVRAILHLRQGKPIIEGDQSGTQLALRCLSAGFAVFDATTPSLLQPSVDTPPCQAAVVSACARFLDCALADLSRSIVLGVSLRSPPLVTDPN